MLIHLEKLGKSFGEKIVLHDVTASVEREDRIGIVGQNGAGKTTLLKILTGEYTDYEGEFSVTHGVTLGYLEQNAKLDPTLDIYGEMRSCFAHVLDAMALAEKYGKNKYVWRDNVENFILLCPCAGCHGPDADPRAQNGRQPGGCLSAGTARCLAEHH